MIKKVVKVGNNSLMVIINKDIIERMNIKEGNSLVVDIVRNLKKGYEK